MRRVVIAGVAVAALAAVPVAAASGKATHHKCGNAGSEIRNLQAWNVTCGTARKVAHAETSGKKHAGWTCHETLSGSTGEESVKCTHAGNEKATWKVPTGY